MKKQIKVLIVDDSMVSRTIISKGIATDDDLQIVGTASDPFEARDKIAELMPDVITMDLNMPKMNGIVFIQKLMAQVPIPVVVISSSSQRLTEAMNAGAVDFIAKPDIKDQNDLSIFIHDVVNRVKAASAVKVGKTYPERIPAPPTPVQTASSKVDLIAIGASTGGTEAILEVLKSLPKTAPGIVIVQHMPPVFTKMYAERLNQICDIEVKEAENGDIVRKGLALIAPGFFQMMVMQGKGNYYVKCTQGEKVSGHCPSVDVLFASVAKAVGSKAMGVIMTGMGSDGARGLLSMREEGAYTIGQDESTCVVYGMPMVAYTKGAVKKQVPLGKIAEEICRHCMLLNK